MKKFILPAVCLLLVFSFLIVGCGGGSGSGDSISSSWLGLTADPDAAGNLQVDIRPSSVSVRPGQTIALSVFVKDGYGHPLDGAKLAFASQLGGTFDDKSVETAKGWASNLFTAGKQPGTESIIVMSGEKSYSQALLVQNPVVVNPTIQIVTSADIIKSGSAVTVAVGVSENGAPSDGAEVKLSSPLGGDFTSDSGKVENGWFTTTFKPGDISGIVNIVAMVNDAKATKALSVVKDKIASPTLSISVNPPAIFQGQTASIIVIATDENGAAADVVINLSADVNGSFSNNDKQTSGGVFYSEFTAGKEVGSATITASSGFASVSTILSVEIPEIIMKVSPSVNTVKVKDRIPVSVLITDNFSSPIENAPVYLSAELGCYCSPDDGKTNDDGYFFFDFVASTTAGVSKIHALTTGATGTAQITVVGP
ncbi:MAG TPA: hypothetical protein PKN29_00700 [Candidatus Ozemobacteraceae bacterium]|nr:hypothetical protein [Candidatus Ozemobacteraceae bacterium]